MPQKFIVRGQRVGKDKVALAKEMRSNMTTAEKTLWQNLRANRLGGWHFRRQQIIFGYIVDFYCHATSLIVEVDGEIHQSQHAADRERDTILTEKGFKILRFRNHEIESDISAILTKILATCHHTSPNTRNSPPLFGEGPGERSKEQP
jgi:very-short-patch-repair endonuclease